MTRQIVGIAFVGLLSVAAGSAAGQVAPRIPRPPAAPVVPPPQAPPVLPVLPAPPAPPLPPDLDVDLNLDLNFDFNPDFAVDFNLDLDAIRESARQAVESARAFAFDFSGPSQRSEGRADALYRQAREAIDRARYDRAIEQLDRLASLTGSNRIDAALYWKSYALAKQGQRAEALTTLADLQKRFADSRWLKDAKALEVEIRQASGQAVSPDAENDEELKLLALRGLMQSDPDRAVAMIEKLLVGNSSVKLRENALFVLSQSRSARAHDVITSVARNGNPDLQLRAIRFLGAMGGAENRQALDEVYRATSDTAIKRAILRSFMTAGDRARLLSAAKSEGASELRGEAVQQLGVMRASAELWDLYQAEASVDVKRRIIQALFVGGAADRLTELARNEKDATLRRTAVHNLGLMSADKTADTLRAIYTSDTSPDVRREVINALFIQRNPSALVDLARAEKDGALKKEIVSKLSMMKSKEATDYLLELLK